MLFFLKQNNRTVFVFGSLKTIGFLGYNGSDK